MAVLGLHVAKVFRLLSQPSRPGKEPDQGSGEPAVGKGDTHSEGVPWARGPALSTVSMTGSLAQLGWVHASLSGTA